MSEWCLSTRLSRPPPATQPLAFDDDGEVLWGAFLQDVTGVMREVERHAGQRWMLCFGDTYWFAVALFALLHTGRRIVIPGNMQQEALTELASSADGCLHDEIAVSPLKTAIRLPLPTGELRVAAFDALNADQIHITLLTSGSTGEPKPVVKTLADLETEVRTLEEVWGDQLDGCRVVSTVSHQHIYGLLFRLLWPLCAGRPFGRNQLMYPEQVVTRARPDTALIASPAMLKRVLDDANDAYRVIFSSGGPLPLESAHRSRDLLGPLPIEVFGSTETGGIGWRRQTERDLPWQLLPGIEADVDANECLRIRSPYMTPRDWCPTSDQCKLMEDGRFRWLGRVDRVVKIEEKRVSLSEVEKRLVQLDWISDAVVLQVGSDGGPSKLGAVIVLAEVGRAVMDELGKGKFWIRLRGELRRWLEPAAVPRLYRVVEEIPVNSQGKRMVRELSNLFAESNALDT